MAMLTLTVALLLLFPLSSDASLSLLPQRCSPSSIRNSNRTGDSMCPLGSLGDSCAFQCDDGYFPIGKHVCQSYKSFVNYSWFGGRCAKNCENTPPCSSGALLRYNTSQNCYAQRCFSSSDELLRHITLSSYNVWKISRNSISGLYSDNVDLLQGDGVPGKDAATGVTGLGLIVECVANALGFENLETQQKKVIKTLETMSGLTNNVAFPRSPHSGFFVHFLDATTGESKDQNSCMMCTGLAMSGILFAKTYFEHVDPNSGLTKKISNLSIALWESTHFENLLCDSSSPPVVSNQSKSGTGIPMVQSFDESCKGVQYPSLDDGYYHFNEEHYTVHFAYQKQFCSPEGKSKNNRGLESMWDAWEGRRLHPSLSYQGYNLLSKWSGYIVQLPYYTSYSFNSDPDYVKLFKNHWLADWLYYNGSYNAGDRGRYGLGAGPTLPYCSDGAGYIADQIDQGQSFCRMYSPYITAGYLPIAKDIIKPQLLELLEDGESVLNFNRTSHILWRKSLLDPTFTQGYGITMVDFSSELLGLATLYVDKDFFPRYTKYFDNVSGCTL